MKKFLNVLDKMFMVLFTSFRGLCEIIGLFTIFLFFFATNSNGQTCAEQTWNYSIKNNGIILTLLLILFFWGLGYIFKTKIADDIDNINKKE